jgi:hypothetical protein
MAGLDVEKWEVRFERRADARLGREVGVKCGLAMKPCFADGGVV